MAYDSPPHERLENVRAERDWLREQLKTATAETERLRRTIARLQPLVDAAHTYADALWNPNVREPRRTRTHQELLLAVRDETTRALAEGTPSKEQEQPDAR